MQTDADANPDVRCRYEGYVLLGVDKKVECDSKEYQDFKSLNIVLIVITQSIPLMYFVVLYRIRDLLHPISDRSPQVKLK